ncbi:MAG: 5-(carboxyamino)imidazole ribonucleotide mutase [Desulfobaccales bacterium]
MSEKKAWVGIILGSASDWPVMEPAATLLDDWGVGVEVLVASAHRSPRRVETYAREAAARGLKVLIAAAGHAAHLAGVVAAHTTLPVVGVPIPSSDLKGLDSLLAMVQMPPGVPVATMAIGAAGARNAAIFAVQVLALEDERLQQRLAQHKEEQAKGVEKQQEKIPAMYHPASLG